jgi:release factor glutamine methyltransferase
MMYAPAPDTFLLAECASKYRGTWALEIGVGSGAVAEELAANFENVAGTDIDLSSLAYCRSMNRKLMLVCCDAASAFSHVKFDLAVANPPYLPNDREKDATVHGGPTGVETTIHFIESALPLLSTQGAMLVVVSSRADQSALDAFLTKKGLKKKVVKEKRLFFERLSVLELTF